MGGEYLQGGGHRHLAHDTNHHPIGNETYAEWTVKAWDWMYDHGLIKTPDSPGSARPYSVFDGTYSTTNCTDLIPIQWTYNAGMLLNAAAVMWNATGDPIWEERVNGLWASSIVSTLTLSVLNLPHVSAGIGGLGNWRAERLY